MEEEKNYEERFIFDRMVKGDKTVFRHFFEKYYQPLCNHINFYIHNPSVAEEIAQDVYVYFWEKREDIVINKSVKSYLFTAAKNRSLNHLRNEKAKLNIREKIAKTVENSSDETPEKIMDIQWLNNLIQQAIDTLPPKCREVFMLSREQKLSYKEIAQYLNISIKTVENQMGKALKLLREFLHPYYNDIFIFLAVLIFAVFSS